ncbi:MAG: hypothetical protein ACKO7P_03600, partial [Bacteroidota bacterium]
MKQLLISIIISISFGDLFAQTQPRLVLPVGHLGGVTKLDGSPNEKLILTEDLNSDIIIIDSEKLIELQRHNYGNWKITSSTFLNDSSVISICNDTLISVWNFYSNKCELFPTTVPLNKVYVENHGLYCIDKHGVVFTFEISEKGIVRKKFIKDKATEVYFKSEREIFLVNGNNLMFVDLNRTNKLNRQFDNEITALSWSTTGNILLGFDNGEIIECDSSINGVHNFTSISDRISVIGYINDSTVISGSYDFSVVTQDKKEILNSILFDDWIVGMAIINREIITCTWNGMINRINYNINIKKDYETGLKKATFFLQKQSNLFISYNDGTLCLYDIHTNKKISTHFISTDPVLGIDANYSSSELIIWNASGVYIFDIIQNEIKNEYKRNNIASAKFIPRTSNFIFCSDEYLYYYTSNHSFDSIPLIDSWSPVETKDNSIIATGLNCIIEINESGIRNEDVPNTGQIWTCLKNESNYILGTSSGELFSLDKYDDITKVC